MIKEFFGGLSKGDFLYFKNNNKEAVGTVADIEWNEGCLYDMKIWVNIPAIYGEKNYPIYVHSSMKECDCFSVKQN